MNLIPRFLVLGVLIGFVSLTTHAQTPVDPKVILRGGCCSLAIIGQTFVGTLPVGDMNGLDYKNMTNQTFTAISLLFTGDSSSLLYTCDNSVDPFFDKCIVTGGLVTFFGLADHPGIVPEGDFNILLQGQTSPVTFDGTAFVSTPEPEAALLFLTGLGAIAGFLKRRSNSVEAS